MSVLQASNIVALRKKELMSLRIEKIIAVKLTNDYAELIVSSRQRLREIRLLIHGQMHSADKNGDNSDRPAPPDSDKNSNDKISNTKDKYDKARDLFKK